MHQIKYKNYLLAVLTIILAFNYLDRVALGIVFQDIKVDLDLSDTQLGFLGGIAFALFYSVMGIPIARWADRGNRVGIIALTTGLWSVAVGLCGLAGTFGQLLLIRVAVAVGEAGCTPPGFSLIADYFGRTERARAAAIYGLGGPISCLGGYFLAGWINELYGWRVTFLVLGAPGIALAALAWFTLREHRHGLRGHAPLVQPGMKQTCQTLWRNVTFRNLLFTLSIMFFFMYGLFQWQPAFIMRTYGLGSAAAGVWFAVTYGVGGIVGSYLGGELASRYAGRNERLQLRVLTLTLAAGGVLACCVYLAPTYQSAFVLMAFYILLMTTINGPLFAMIQTLVPEQLRAVSFAIVYLFCNFIGMGLGPLAAGVLSDSLRPLFGEESLRYALLMLTPGFLLVAWYAWRASNTVTQDLAAAQLTQEYAARESDEGRRREAPARTAAHLS